MKQKTKLIKHIQLWGVILIVGVAGSITGIDVIESYHDFNHSSEHLRANYIASQKQLVKQEVERVVQLISYKQSQKEILTRQTIKSRVNDAYSIAQNIYQQNKSVKSKSEIQKMIVDALRPIRFADGKGYYFATCLDGVEILFADKPEMEGVNLLDVQDTRGKYVIRDMIEIVKNSGEGFYEYHWTKPDTKGNDFKKISFVKLFEPYDLFIGTGLYVEDLEHQIQAELLSNISRIRFGKEGYIFINRLNGDALVSNGKIFSGSKKLWEVFDSNPEKMKKIFKQEYDAAQKPEGDYIYYSHIKLTTPDKQSPKASYIFGIPEWQWLIGAGVYLDDVEKDIAQMQADLTHLVKEKSLLFLVVSTIVIAFFLLIFKRLSQNLKNDTNILLSFFKQAALSKEPINRDLIHFDELDCMAENANKMLEDKIQAEKNLVDSERRFKDLTENSTDWIWEFDENEIFTYASPRIKDLLGYDPEELIGQSAFDPMSSAESAKVMKEFLKYKEARKPFSSLINVNHHKNGNEVIIESSGVPIFDKDGTFRGYRGIDRDITERTNLEEQLRQSHKMEAIGTLAGGIAHDFNNILAAVIGYAELAKLDLPQSSAAKEHVNEILKASNRAKELVGHILSFSRKEASTFVPVQIDLIAKEALKLLRASIPTTIQINENIEPNCGSISGTPTQVHQIFMNLCTNAVQAMEEQGVLSISVTPKAFTKEDLLFRPERSGMKPGEYIAISVSDTGPGIEPQIIDRIFDPYFTTKETGKGSGMGLAVIHGIVKSFGGIIEVESELGKGTTFHAYFPKLKNEQLPKDTVSIMGTGKGKGTESILVVDDEQSIVVMNELRLKQLGYKVTTSIQSTHALEMFRADPQAFDLVITDQTMPNMTGEQLAREILAIRPDIPIILCSGYSSVLNEENVKEMGVSAFIMKPVKYDVFIGTIRQVLDKKHPKPGEST